MKYHLLFVVLLLVGLLSVPSITQTTCGVSCGVERWAVKTLSDSTFGNINQTPVEKTINWLRTRERPASLPNTTRLIGIETMVFKVRGVVLSFKKQADKDFHVIIAQSNYYARTMIIEFPDPQCANVCSSGFLEQMRQSRQDFVDRFGEPPTSYFKKPARPVLVEVTGVGFFDRMHGQIGMAMPSGVELHPVLSFKALQ